ncbi:hypothetical protein F444_22378 [Phytophthora nicotianae P1976]|uniref:Uncharacterized protein n=1 Tax=Phytophthora nicotianae P1976 TaxID=1317066 RepID=A0A080YXZ0_PHYNI|nr:hypothetical protein F444_22378 [Phytophthora nicotianae P1976]
MRLKLEEREQTFRFHVESSKSSDLTWQQQKGGAKVSTGVRSLFSLPVRALKAKTKKSSKEQACKLFAVYTDGLFSGDETRMSCTNCTLLPPSRVSYYAIMLHCLR